MADLYSKWPHTSKDDILTILSARQTPTALIVFQSLEGMEENHGRCRSTLHNLYRNLALENFVGIDDQFKTLGCCKNYRLNYVAAKVCCQIDANRAGNSSNPEEAGVNKYRIFAEDYLQKAIPLSARVKIYHDVNGSWLYPTYAALLGVPPIVFKRSSSGMTSLFARLSKRTATDNNTK